MTGDERDDTDASDRPAFVPYDATEHHEYLVHIRDALKQLVTEMDPADPLYVHAIERLFIADLMISNHVLKQLLKETTTPR